MRCSCGGSLVTKRVEHSDISSLIGLRTVAVSGDLPTCVECGAVALPGQVIEGLSAMLAAAFVKDRLPLDGLSARFLRKYLGLTQEELAGRLDTSRNAVAQWEADESPLSGLAAFALLSMVTLHLTDSPLVNLSDADEAPTSTPHLRELRRAAWQELVEALKHPSKVPPPPNRVQLGSGAVYERRAE